MDNRLSGSVPAELGGLSELLVLALYHNDLTGGLPSELGNLQATAEPHQAPQRRSFSDPHIFSYTSSTNLITQLLDFVKRGG